VNETAPVATDNAATQWWVQARGQAYGPYSQEQLVQFVQEGRVRPSTPVSNKPDSGWAEARRFDALMAPLRAVSTPQHNAPAQDNTVTAANVFVFAEIHSGAWSSFMAALEAMGPLLELSPGLWMLRTHLTAGVMRNTLSQTLERGDRFVVMDATRDRVAWFNLGPGIDVRVKEVWNAAIGEPKKR
jgi:hypothetical protein